MGFRVSSYHDVINETLICDKSTFIIFRENFSFLLSFLFVDEFYVNCIDLDSLVLY